MHPRTLIPDVGHFEQIRVKACFTYRLLKQRFVRSWRARCNDDSIQPVLLYDIFEEILRV